MQDAADDPRTGRHVAATGTAGTVTLTMWCELSAIERVVCCASTKLVLAGTHLCLVDVAVDPVADKRGPSEHAAHTWPRRASSSALGQNPSAPRDEKHLEKLVTHGIIPWGTNTISTLPQGGRGNRGPMAEAFFRNESEVQGNYHDVFGRLPFRDAPF